MDLGWILVDFDGVGWISVDVGGVWWIWGGFGSIYVDLERIWVPLRGCGMDFGVFWWILVVCNGCWHILMDFGGFGWIWVDWVGKSWWILVELGGF